MRISFRLPSRRVHLSLRVQFVAVTLVWFLTEKCLQGEVVVEVKSSLEDCRVIQFKPATHNRSLMSHVMKSVWVTSEAGCESNCFAEDYCMSINFGPKRQEKHLCELSSSDHNLHPEDLKERSSFIYKSMWNYCSSRPCPPGYRCQTGFTNKRYRCIENWKKISEDPVCFGVDDDSFGAFSIRESGLIYTFKLVHRNGSVTCNHRYKLNNWGCTHPLFGKNQLLTVITYPNRSALLIANHLRSNAGCDYKYYAYQLEGTDVDSPELVFNRLLHPLSVSVGQKFQIWYGEDLTDCEGNNNMGMTCTDIYGWYV